MSVPSRDDSVFDEPHVRGGGYRPDPSEARVSSAGEGTDRGDESEDERVEHTVWDEPGLSPVLAGAVPPAELTYRRWLEKRRGQVSPAKSWMVTFLVVLVAGPWAFLGAFWGRGQTAFSIVALVLFGPIVEEMMKNAVGLYVVEKRPFLFRSSGQIAVCALAGGFVFAALENLLYLGVYTSSASIALVQWRWTVCVAMHMGCSLIVGMGLIRIWRDTWQRLARPRITLGFPFIVAAVIAHGAYNGFALVLAAAGYRL